MLAHVKRTPDRWGPLHSGRTTQNYYVPRQAPTTEEADYWQPKPDPDGNIRDRAGERDLYLSDLGAEIAWLKRLQSRTTATRFRALDLGSGRGWLCSAMPDQWEKWAVETSSVGAAACRAYAEVIEGEWRGVFPDEHFDVITCHHVIEHLSDPIDHVHEIRRTLKKGGNLLLATPDFASPCAKRFGDNYRMLHDPTHVSLFTLESMARMLTEFGFTIEDVQFPFPDRYATAETMGRWLDTSKVSPPWPGNWMTFYARK